MIVNIYFKLVTSALRPRGASHFVRQKEITLISKKRASCLRANNRRPSLFCYPQSNWSIRSNFAELLSELDWPPDIETWRSRSAATAILESIIADGGSIYRFKSYLYQRKKWSTKHYLQRLKPGKAILLMNSIPNFSFALLDHRHSWEGQRPDATSAPRWSNG